VIKIKKNKKRYFSIIYVPDQERDPRSFSMSYAKGHLLLILSALLAVHSIVGLIGYYEIFRFDRSIQNLRDENRDLKAKNKRIDDIAMRFQTILQTEEKIRRAFGETLGLNGSPFTNRPAAAQPATAAAVPKTQASRQATPAAKKDDGFYFLSKNPKAPPVPDNLPTLLPVEGFITSHFQNTVLYNGRSHYGIDIAAPMGSIVYASGAGVVLLADWTPDFGNMIILSHGQGLVSYYGHAQRLLVDQGMAIKKGQAIAMVGSSGISSAPHLHYEIWENGKALDPEEYFFSIQKQKTVSGK
jgi:murein DD-endopeptidase MepM/ murein hydrolase activator NlpD